MAILIVCERVLSSGMGYVMQNTEWVNELSKVSQCPQRQDSLEDQLKDLVDIANKFGFYDAADYLKFKQYADRKTRR